MSIESLIQTVQALRKQNLLDEAMLVLQQGLHDYPQEASIDNAIGNIYFAKQQWQEAAAAYQQAIDKQAEYIDAYYNLGLALSKAQEKQQAINSFKAVLLLAPNYVAAKFQLANLYMSVQDRQQAIQLFAAIEKEYPSHVETQINLATCYFQQGFYDKAIEHYLKALALEPNDAQVLFNLGLIYMKQHNIRKAIEYYSQALPYAQDQFTLHNNLAVAFLKIKNQLKALEHFQAALRIKPQDATVNHMVHVLLKDKQISVSPPEYIAALFDDYAHRYDEHLIHDLQYQIPDLFAQTLQALHLDHPLNILDLGCGTGLCAPILKPYAAYLSGVDLSAAMLAEAAEKHLYDELAHQDIHAFLADKNKAYDLIVAGDVLVYMGNLQPLFKLVSQALKPQGCFLFNLEINSQSDYALSDSGRFSHAVAYVQNLALETEFSIVKADRAKLRLQAGEFIEGELYLLQRY